MKERGFTLLEVMIALAILGAALIVLLRMSTSDVRASYRARMLTIATGLAQAKMLDLEEELLRDGFQDTDQEESGDFTDEKQPHFAWKALIEKVDLPAIGQLSQGAGGDKQATPPPGPDDVDNQQQLLGLAGGSETGALGASMVQLYFPLIRPVIENAIRKVTLQVSWKAGGEADSIKVIAFYTDTKAITQAGQLMGAAAGGADATGGGPVTAGGTGASK